MYRLKEFLTTTLTPSDTALGDVATADWWKYIKPHFDDTIWQYFDSRVVFAIPKFPEDDSSETYNNILRSFAINLKTKARSYERMYDVIMADYNPLWNVDGVTGRVFETTHTGTDTRAKSGYDTNAESGTDRTVQSGQDVSTLSGSDVNAQSGSDVNTLGGQDRLASSGSDVTSGSVDESKSINISKDDHTKTGTETISKGGNDVTEKKVATFDSYTDEEVTLFPTEEDTLKHGEVDTHTYNTVDGHQMIESDSLDQDTTSTTRYGKTDTTQYGKIDTTQYGKRDTMTYGKSDTMTYGKTDATTYGKQDRTTYNSQEQDTKALKDSHVEMEIRQGNIGLTTSMSLVTDELELWDSQRVDFIKKVVRDCVNIVTYAVEGV